jgi:polyisoprenoid-binding protein YceI
MFRRTLITTLCAVGLAAATAAKAAPETYVIDDKHTLPRFEYSHFGYSTQMSRFDKVKGTITLDRTARRGSVEVEIDARSINTGVPLFNEHIQAADFFDTAHYPTITFKSQEFRFEGDRLAEVVGDLTIKGITRRVRLEVISMHCMPHPIYKKDACGVNARTVLKRSDFNMGKYAPGVSDEVTVSLPVEAIKQ